MGIRIGSTNEIQIEENKKTSKPIEDDGLFAAVFSEQLGGASTKTPESISMLEGKPATIDPTLMTALNTIDPSSDSSRTDLDFLTEQTASLLEKWEAYGQSLQQGASPREIWDMLSNMEQQLGAMENSQPQQVEAQGLGALLNELKILTTVEKAKVNRGDYI